MTIRKLVFEEKITKGKTMDQKTAKLYTRQNDKTLFQLERENRIINNRVYVELHFGDIAPLFMESYGWFTKEAAKRVSKPQDMNAPIWCSISKENCLKPIEGTVVYVLEVPKKQVIYFDECKWDYVLNRIYLPRDEEDGALYREYLKKLGVANGFEFFQGRYGGMFPEEERKIRESWNRVFDIDNWTIFNVCGNIWEIKKEWVRRIVRPGEEL